MSNPLSDAHFSTSRSNISNKFGHQLREWRSLTQPKVQSINWAELPFQIDDDESLDNPIPRTYSKLRRHKSGPTSVPTYSKEDSSALPDSHPQTPQISSINADQSLPRTKSTRKGVKKAEVTRPAQEGPWSVSEKDWGTMTLSEQRRAAHVAQIMAGRFGKRASEKCKECAKGSSTKLEKLRKLRECWVHKDRSIVAQCAGCLFQHQSCSFAKRSSRWTLDEHSLHREDQLISRNRPDFPVGPTSEDVSTALEQLSGRNWLGNSSINLLLKNVVLLNDAHSIEIANPPIDPAGWKSFASRYTAPNGHPLVFIPLYFPSHSHWTLLTLNTTDCRATFYDSLMRGRLDAMPASSAIVRALGYDWDASDWKLCYAMEVPGQRDSHSCGLVVLIVGMHLMLKMQMPKNVNFDLWRILFRRALGEAADHCRLDVQSLLYKQQNGAERLAGQVDDAIKLISMLYSQASMEKLKLQRQLEAWSDSTSQPTGDAAGRNSLETPLRISHSDAGRLHRTLSLRSAQSDNLLRAFGAANGLRQALASRPDAGHFESDIHPSNSATRVKADIGQGTTAQSSDAAVALSIQPSQWDIILWIAVPDNPPATRSNTLSIQYFPDDINALGHDTYLGEALQTGLGHGMVKKQHGGVYVHQGLATILAVRWKKIFAVRLHRWDWLMDQLRNHLLLTTCNDSKSQPQSTVIFIHATTEEPPNLREVYDEIRNLAPAHGAGVRLYPSESEWRRQRMKIGDIRALDEIARSAPTEFSHRPRTCFGQGPCQLLDCETTVHKRSYSSGAAHVKVLEKGSFADLTCISVPLDEPHRLRTTRKRKGTESSSPLKSYTKRKQSSTFQTQQKQPRPSHQPKSLPENEEQSPQAQDRLKQNEHGSHGQLYWFHQEFVPGLHSGEFRVFIATKPDAHGIRGRSGYIVAMAKTAWHWETESLAVRSVEDDTDFHHLSCGTLSRQQLEQFSLYIFEALRSRDDRLFSYESLEVGVRLDVGVADDKHGEKQFFVNEITRWYNAHYFSNNICAEPKTQICKAFAEAFSSYVRYGMPRIP